MDKTQLRRHDLVYLSQKGKDKVWQSLDGKYFGDIENMVKNVLQGFEDIPAFVRRDECAEDNIALGFVPPERIGGNRLRIGVFADIDDVVMVMSPYEVMQRKAYAHNAQSKCVEAVVKLYNMADAFDVQIGVLGSAALELATGLHYTDDASDIDLLVKPARLEMLEAFYRAAETTFSDINMDFELDLPNGYGVKLAEVFASTKTVLGKSLDDVALLDRQEVLKYLN